MNEVAQRKIETLTSKLFPYAKFYAEVKDKYQDDRRLFQNIYEILLENLNIMGEIESSYIWVAFNKQYREDIQTLENIIERFSNQMA